MEFKQWLEKLNEVGTSTASVASFQRIAIPMVQRQWPNDGKKKKKKKKKKSS